MLWCQNAGSMVPVQLVPSDEKRTLKRRMDIEKRSRDKRKKLIFDWKEDAVNVIRMEGLLQCNEQHISIRSTSLRRTVQFSIKLLVDISDWWNSPRSTLSLNLQHLVHQSAWVDGELLCIQGNDHHAIPTIPSSFSRSYSQWNGRVAASPTAAPTWTR